MSDTIYAAKFEQTIIHQHLHLQRESQSHATVILCTRCLPPFIYNVIIINNRVILFHAYVILADFFLNTYGEYQSAKTTTSVVGLWSSIKFISIQPYSRRENVFINSKDLCGRVYSRSLTSDHKPTTDVVVFAL
jgi:hypothetical protein